MPGDALAALDRVFELAARLGGLMQRDLAERGLSPARAELLFVLDQRGPMVQRQLSEMLRCSPRHVTWLVDALEEQGLVVRNRHPSDRRATMVSLSDRGASVAARMDAERRQAARDLFGDLPPADVDRFVAVADHVLDRLGRPAVADGPASPDG